MENQSQENKNDAPLFPMEKIRTIVLPILAVLFVAALGSAFVDPSGVWYEALQKPPFQPPALAFRIVWTILYVLIAWAAARAFLNEAAPDKKRSLALAFAVNGALNALWSYVFFGRQNPSMALFVLLLLIVSTALLIRHVKKIDDTASLLLLPYLAWIIFAAVLNYAIAMLN